MQNQSYHKTSSWQATTISCQYIYIHKNNTDNKNFSLNAPLNILGTKYSPLRLIWPNFGEDDLENFGRSSHSDSEGECSGALSFFCVYSMMGKISRNIGFIGK